MKAPFPYFGGKSTVADVVWQALGQPKHYIEPFFGSGAVLLNRPDYNPVKHMETICDKDGYVCVAPETKILKSDLTWHNAGDLKEGQTLLGFDEERTSAHRHWRLSTILKISRLMLPCYRLTFDDGTIVTCSEDHMWLSGSHRPGSLGGRSWRWIKTKSMVCNRKAQRSWVMKLTSVTDKEDSHDAGWIGGFLDGEGHIVKRSGFRVSFSQNEGDSLNRAVDLLESRGFEIHRSTPPGKCAYVNVNGGMRETLRLLMLTRPERLIKNLNKFIESNSIYGREHRAVGLVEKEYLGQQEVVSITTSTHTFIAEGLASHNCNVWRALQLDPDAVARVCDWPVNHADLMARRQVLLRNSDRLLENLITDEKWFDAELAGYWVWAASCWIGSGLTRPKAMPDTTNAKGVHKQGLYDPGRYPDRAGQKGVHKVSVSSPNKRPHLGHDGAGVHGIPDSGPRPQVGVQGAGVHVVEQIPHLTDDRGINSQIPLLNHEAGICRRPCYGSESAHGVHRVTLTAEPDVSLDVRDPYTPGLWVWFRQLSERLRRVRVVCGDWTRVCGGDWQDGRGTCGMFFDPPYSAEAGRDPVIYQEESGTVAHDVREWCRSRADRKSYRLVLAGYIEEHSCLLDEGWTVHRWSAHGGFANKGKGKTKGEENRHKEALFFSPHCHSSGLRRFGLEEVDL